MKKQFIIMMFATAFLCVSSAFAQPKIEVIGGDVYDWKDVRTNEKELHADIKIKNIGDSILKISEVKPSCGCTTAPLDNYNLKPGEKATLTVTLKLDNGATGNISKNIRISSNDPVTSSKYLTIKANIIRPIQIAPAYFAFNELKVGTEAKVKVRMKNTTDKIIKIYDIALTGDGFSLDLRAPKAVKPGEEFDVYGTAKPLKQGYYSVSAKFKTDCPEMQEFMILGYGNVKPSPIFNSK